MFSQARDVTTNRFSQTALAIGAFSTTLTTLALALMEFRGLTITNVFIGNFFFVAGLLPLLSALDVTRYADLSEKGSAWSYPRNGNLSLETRMRILFSLHSDSSMVALVLLLRLCLEFRRPMEQIQQGITMRWGFLCSVSEVSPKVCKC